MVLRAERKWSTCIWRRVTGSPFQVTGPATEKSGDSSVAGLVWWSNRAHASMVGPGSQCSAWPKQRFYKQCDEGKVASVVHPICTLWLGQTWECSLQVGQWCARPYSGTQFGKLEVHLKRYNMNSRGERPRKHGLAWRPWPTCSNQFDSVPHNQLMIHLLAEFFIRGTLLLCIF